MTYELTKDSLFNYFSPDVIAQMIDIPLVQRHLSALDYRECLEILSNSERRAACRQNENADFEHALLEFDSLKDAPLIELLRYLSIDAIRKAYLKHYREYFLFFEERVLLSQTHPEEPSQPRPLLLDTTREQKLIELVKATLGTPLAAFINAILVQNALLEQLQSQFVGQAENAQRYIEDFDSENTRYKQTVVSFAFSVAKLGLNIINVGELIEVSRSLATLAASSFDKFETKMHDLVTDIQSLVMNKHYLALQEAEHFLMSTAAPEKIRYAWEQYRASVLLESNKSIQEILDGCINNDDFIRCVIKEIIAKKVDLTFDKLFIDASKRANNYIKDIVNSLQSRIAIIKQIADAANSQEGGEKIETYYRRIGLIDYTLQHEHGGVLQSWLTKKLGHRLSFYFPTLVFQKKMVVTKRNVFFSSGSRLCKRNANLGRI